MRSAGADRVGEEPKAGLDRFHGRFAGFFDGADEFFVPLLGELVALVGVRGDELVDFVHAGQPVVGIHAGQGSA
jgi:hypothetical protein